jgi:outer membrane protein assembly factor BamB
MNMSIAQTDVSTARKPLRLWPGVVAAALLVVIRFLVPLVFADSTMLAFIGGLIGALVIALWWVFFSRAPWSERLGALVMVAVAFFATKPFLDKSIATGMMGMMFAIYAIPPVVSPALVAWAVATRHLSDGLRRATMVATILLACAAWTLLRTDGIMGGAGAQLAWRWTKTPEQRLLAQASDDSLDSTRAGSTPQPASAAPEIPKAAPVAATVDSPAARPPVPTAASPEPRAPAAVKSAPAVSMVAARTPEWPGFRGAGRDGVVRGVRIATDWSQSPPVQLWRRGVGPGWSSFAVSGDLFYTQEQRGDSEVVSCYRVSTGQPVWRHRDAVRFWESNGGAGPRATPTLSNGRVYTFGATGILNALDAGNGALVWSHDVAADTGKKVPMWGFSSSPLVVDDVVVVASTGTLVGYDLATGKQRWSGPAHAGSYSSPHLVTIDGGAQVLLLSAAGATSVAPADGSLLWEYPWAEGGVTIVQPASFGNGDILISTTASTGGLGIRRLAVAQKDGRWSVEERWTSSGLKPYFNDFVVHKGHAFGFDGSILSCIDLTDGTRKWKGGRYGSGQLVLLSDQDLLLVVSEEGELALVDATPDQFTEVARFPALEGKTWNHPVVVGDVLLVRNDQDMAAYKLSRLVR